MMSSVNSFTLGSKGQGHESQKQCCIALSRVLASSS